MERSWDVDCEYNRTGTAEAAAVKRWRASNKGATDGQLPPTVTPDVIVHRRGLPGRANNLLVLELKCVWGVHDVAGGAFELRRRHVI
jgi:hypothetical protein